MNLTAEKSKTLNISRLEITVTFPWDDFEKWCEVKADEEGQSQYTIYDNDGNEEYRFITGEFLFDKYLEENDIDSLAKEYLLDKLNLEQ